MAKTTGIISEVTDTVQKIGIVETLLLGFAVATAWAAYRIIKYLAEGWAGSARDRLKWLEKENKTLKANHHNCRKKMRDLEIKVAEAEGRAQALSRALRDSGVLKNNG